MTSGAPGFRRPRCHSSTPSLEQLSHDLPSLTKMVRSIYHHCNSRPRPYFSELPPTLRRGLGSGGAIASRIAGHQVIRDDRGTTQTKMNERPTNHVSFLSIGLHSYSPPRRGPVPLCLWPQVSLPRTTTLQFRHNMQDGPIRQDLGRLEGSSCVRSGGLMWLPDPGDLPMTRLSPAQLVELGGPGECETSGVPGYFDMA